MRRMLLVGALLALPALLWANHGHWIDHYRSASGGACCGVRDCVQVNARLVKDRGTGWLAEVNGTFVELPKGSVYPSQGAHSILVPPGTTALSATTVGN